MTVETDTNQLLMDTKAIQTEEMKLSPEKIISMSTADAVSTAAASLVVDENNHLREHLKMRQAAMTQLEEVLTKQTERAHAIVSQSRSDQQEMEKKLSESELENRQLKQRLKALQESLTKSTSQYDSTTTALRSDMEAAVKEVCYLHLLSYSNLSSLPPRRRWECIMTRCKN